MQRGLAVIKCITIIAFLVTLSTTYYVRSEVLGLSTIRFSSDNARAEQELKDLKESYPLRVEEYEVANRNYELQMEHYQEMLALYRTDYDAYVKKIEDKYQPPQLPRKPSKPRSPELSDQLASINAEFRARQFQYYETTSRLNWVCCASALALVGGLLTLLMFDEGNQKLFYLAVLVLSFVFMIGPSFHSIMSGIIGFLRAPPVY